MNARQFLSLGALLGLLTVALGAFGAHILQPVLAADLMRVWEKAVHYQGLHALALLVVGGLLLQLGDQRLLRLAGLAFVTGVVLFSGSLYLLALSEIRPLGMITPLGGVAFLLGWLALLLAVRKALP